MQKNQAHLTGFFQPFCGVLSGIVILCALQTRGNFGILLQRGIAILDCEAAALPGRFLPELGRSSERPFFLIRGVVVTGHADSPGGAVDAGGRSGLNRKSLATNRISARSIGSLSGVPRPRRRSAADRC